MSWFGVTYPEREPESLPAGEFKPVPVYRRVLGFHGGHLVERENEPGGSHCTGSVWFGGFGWNKGWDDGGAGDGVRLR